MREPVDQAARVRFASELDTNFAVCANAGAGKTTAISQRLAALALRDDARTVLARTAVVTYTKKAARQIGQRARSVLLAKLSEQGRRDLTPLDHLERAFFGTIHSFCVQLAQRYGHRLGVHLNPEVLDEQGDEAVWMDFISRDPMVFRSVTAEQWALFSRLQALDGLFPLARSLSRARATRLRARTLPLPPKDLPDDALKDLLASRPKQARYLEKWQANVDQVHAWRDEFLTGGTYLSFPKPDGKAGGVDEIYKRLFSPLKRWIADAGGIIAAELSDRFRAYRLEHGLQTYADQVDLALRALTDHDVLERIRGDGWRVILDEAQDTDPEQFSVLVEITRQVGALPGTWPEGGGQAPRSGHFSLVGDGQQSIYSSRADLRNFMRHVDAFGRGDGGERLSFSVSFRAPGSLISFLNAGLPEAFGESRDYNFGLPPAPDAPAPLLQVPYQALSERPDVEPGAVRRLPLLLPKPAPRAVSDWMADECRQVARFLAKGGPASVGAASWGDVCLLAPRNDWLKEARDALLAEGIKVALQQRRSRNADNPVFAWWSGLLAVTLDPANAFEWFGVLRELFAVPDDVLAKELRRLGSYRWDEPEDHAPELTGPLACLRPLLLSAEDEGQRLGDWAEEVARSTGMRAFARELDPSGGLEGELDRLLAEATQFGLDGASPREWFEHLLSTAEEGRPVGRPEADAVNLLTVHSAKGLEWPVVIALGLWRGIGRRSETGLQCLDDPVHGLQLYYDGGEIPENVAVSREREAYRELVRLKYVALTRPQRQLILPWAEEYGAKPLRNQRSFAQLWGDTRQWAALPAVELVAAEPETDRQESGAKGIVEPALSTESSLEADELTLRPLPERVLPHALAQHPDPARLRLDDQPREPAYPVGVVEDAAAYGIWWHETVEFWPWTATPADEETYVTLALQRAEAAGWGTRARAELDVFRASEARRIVGGNRWRRQAELPVLAPLEPMKWIDGIIDLVLRDEAQTEVWIVDWKTNLRRQAEPEEAFCDRLTNEYRPQLEAYCRAIAPLFPSAAFKLWLYPTGLGKLVPIN